jgi:hypothetical protein
MVVSYMPRQVDPFGLTALEATCESVKVERSKTRARAVKKDAVEWLMGKSFTLKVNPAGKIEDYFELDGLIKEIGKKAFRPPSRRGRIKEPDMIGDFWASQWFLWDAVSSVPNAASGVRPGDSWRSSLYVPAPMVMRKARDVEYSLERVDDGPEGRLAVIASRFKLAEGVPAGWPVPYTGSFQMSGTFGFLRGYRVLELEGGGRELFNIDKGRIRNSSQQYKMKVQASLPAAMGIQPLITIRQKLTMEPL